MPLFKKKSASDQQTVERQALLDFLGISDDGEALGEATYFACIKILSEAIGKMPFKIMRTTPEAESRRQRSTSFTACLRSVRIRI